MHTHIYIIERKKKKRITINDKQKKYINLNKLFKQNKKQHERNYLLQEW